MVSLVQSRGAAQRAPRTADGFAAVARFAVAAAVVFGVMSLVVKTNSLTYAIGAAVLFIALGLMLIRPYQALLVVAAGWGSIHAEIVHSGGSTITISKAIGILILVGLGAAAFLLRARGGLSLPRPLTAVALFVPLYFAAILHGVDRSGAISDLLKVATGVVLAAIAYFTINSRRRLLTLSKAAVFSGIVVAVFATLQYTLHQVAPGVASSLFGSSYYIGSSNAGSTTRVLRVAGAFGGADATAGYLFVCAAFALLRFTLRRNTERARGDVIAMIVITVGILATLTRAATAAMVILVVTWAFLWQIRSVSATRVRLRLIVVVLFAVLGAVALLGSSTIGARLLDVNPTSSNFAMGRVAIWQQELQTLRTSTAAQLVLGHGAHRAYAKFFSIGTGEPILMQPHNLYFWLLVDSGLVGLAVYVSFLVGLGLKYVRAVRLHRFGVRAQVASVGFATLLAFIAHSFFALAPVSAGLGWYFMLFVGATLRPADLDVEFDERDEKAEPPLELPERELRPALATAAAAPAVPQRDDPFRALPFAPPARPYVPAREFLPSGWRVPSAPAVRGMWERVARDAAVLISSALSLVVLQLVFRLQAIRYLSVSNYGRIALLLGVFAVVTVLGQYGIPAAAARLGARTHGHRRDRELLASMCTAALAPTLVAALLMGASTYWVTHSVFLAAVGFAGTPPLVASGLSRGFIRGKGMVWPSALVQPANLGAQIAALAIVVALGVDVGVGWVLACFVIGNVAAFLVGAYYVWQALRRSSSTDEERDPEATPRKIFAFSMWLSASNVALLALTLLPRLSLAHVSFRQVAFMDLALLIYTIPQRLKASFLIALIPVAAVEQKRKATIVVPSAFDLAIVSAGVFVADGLLWASNGVTRFFDLVGMHHYAGVEPLLLILLLGAPAEFFFGLNSGLLQALGESKRLAYVSGSVLLASVALAVPAAFAGAPYLALLIAADFWVLYVLARRLLGDVGVAERSMIVTALSGGWRRIRRRRASRVY